MFCIRLVVDTVKFLVFLPILGENLGCTPFLTIDSTTFICFDLSIVYWSIHKICVLLKIFFPDMRLILHACSVHHGARDETGGQVTKNRVRKSKVAHWSLGHHHSLTKAFGLAHSCIRCCTAALGSSTELPQTRCEKPAWIQVLPSHSSLAVRKKMQHKIPWAMFSKPCPPSTQQCKNLREVANRGL
jgi:hypothetical protein